MAKGPVAFKFDTKGIALFNLNKASTRIKGLAKSSLVDMLGVTQTNIKTGAPVGATGNLRNEINIELRELSGRVYGGAPYTVIIEKGRKAGPVSREADPSLISWLRTTRKGRRMLVNTRAMMMKKRKSSPTTAQVMRSALFILKRSMKNKKRKKNPFFANGVKKSTPYIKRRSEKYIKDLAKALAKP